MPTNSKSNVGFRLPNLNLTLAYSNGQLRSWHDVLHDCAPRTNSWTRCVRLSIVIQIVNVLILHFKVKVSNGIHSKCVMHPSVQAYRHGHGGNGRTDHANHHDFKGCQEWSWTTFRQDMSRGVSLQPDFKRNATHCILAPFIHWSVSVCVCCVCVCVCV